MIGEKSSEKPWRTEQGFAEETPLFISFLSSNNTHVLHDNATAVNCIDAPGRASGKIVVVVFCLIVGVV
jgi:hypothetical protein